MKLSVFIRLNKELIIDDIVINRRTSQIDIARIWNSRFVSGTNKEDAAEVDSEKVNWSELLESGIEKSKEVIEQSIRIKRNLTIWEAYEKENEMVGQIIAKRQAEDSIEKVSQEAFTISSNYTENKYLYF